MDPGQRSWRKGLLIGLGVAVGIAFILIATNIIYHATHQVSKTPVATRVLGVHANSASQVTMTLSVTSLSASSSSVSCLVGVELPSTPLAYPTRVTVSLQPYQTSRFAVTRSLLRPQANGVTAQDVAFACT